MNRKDFKGKPTLDMMWRPKHSNNAVFVKDKFLIQSKANIRHDVEIKGIANFWNTKSLLKKIETKNLQLLEPRMCRLHDSHPQGPTAPTSPSIIQHSS